MTFSPNKSQLPCIKAFLFFVSFLYAFLSAFNGSAQTENEIYAQIKLEILCYTIKFVDRSFTGGREKISCNSLAELGNSISEEAKEAAMIFKTFQRLTYESYGKGKLSIRLDKLIADIETEVKKISKDAARNEEVKKLTNALKRLKQENLTNLQSGIKTDPISADTLEEFKGEQRVDPPVVIENNEENTKHQNTMNFILILIFLVILGGLAFLAWQNQQMKKIIGEMEDQFIEKYSRVDNRIDMMTPHRDFQSMLLKINFINDQLNAIVQEIAVLKNRNEFKMKPEELVAKRTEHLESYTYNPNVQIYYARIRPNSMVFYQEDLKTEPSKEYIYKIEINLHDPEQAIYSIVDRNEFHPLALANPHILLETVCEYANSPNNAYRIVTLEPGLVEKKENNWFVLKKARLTFE